MDYKIFSYQLKNQRLVDTFSKMKVLFRLHMSCGKDYCRESSINAELKKHYTPDRENKHEPIHSKLRRSTKTFSQNDDCFFCGETIVDQTKLTKHRRREVSSFTTLSLDKLTSKFKESSTDFVRLVNDRYERVKAFCSDMPSAECKYHRDCYSCFLNSGCKISERIGKSGRPNDTIKNLAFEKLDNGYKNDQFLLKSSLLVDISISLDLVYEIFV